MALDPVTLARLWIAVRPIKKWKERRARKRGETVSQPDEVAMLQGKKTYLGIAAALIGVVLGWLGIGGDDASALSSQLVGAADQVLTVGGLLFAAYGRAKAQPKA